MASIPGYCPHCGYVFDGRGGIQIENSIDITVSGGRTTCPRCGRRANLIEGTFNERGRGLELVSGPPLSRAILEQLSEIARRAQANEITPEAAIDQIQAIDPSLGSLLRRVPYLNVVSLMVAIIALYLQFEGDRESSEFRKEVVDLLRRQTEVVELLSSRFVREGPGSSKSGVEEDLRSQKGEEVKKPPRGKRRAEVNKARRKALKERRRMFPRRTRRY